jgi:hypothetical protein
MTSCFCVDRRRGGISDPLHHTLFQSREPNGSTIAQSYWSTGASSRGVQPLATSFDPTPVNKKGELTTSAASGSSSSSLLFFARPFDWCSCCGFDLGSMARAIVERQEMDVVERADAESLPFLPRRLP